MKMQNKTYDFWKAIAQLWIPAISALYFGLAQIWGWPYGEEIVGSLACVDAFLGVVLGISTYNYNNEVKGA